MSHLFKKHIPNYRKTRHQKIYLSGRRFRLRIVENSVTSYVNGPKKIKVERRIIPTNLKAFITNGRVAIL